MLATSSTSEKRRRRLTLDEVKKRRKRSSGAAGAVAEVPAVSVISMLIMITITSMTMTTMMDAVSGVAVQSTLQGLELAAPSVLCLCVAGMVTVAVEVRINRPVATAQQPLPKCGANGMAEAQPGHLQLQPQPRQQASLWEAAAPHPVPLMQTTILTEAAALEVAVSPVAVAVGLGTVVMIWMMAWTSGAASASVAETVGQASARLTGETALMTSPMTMTIMMIMMTTPPSPLVRGEASPVAALLVVAALEALLLQRQGLVTAHLWQAARVDGHLLPADALTVGAAQLRLEHSTRWMRCRWW